MKLENQSEASKFKAAHVNRSVSNDRANQPISPPSHLMQPEMHIHKIMESSGQNYGSRTNNLYPILSDQQ